MQVNSKKHMYKGGPLFFGGLTVDTKLFRELAEAYATRALPMSHT